MEFVRHAPFISETSYNLTCGASAQCETRPFAADRVSLPHGSLSRYPIQKVMERPHGKPIVGDGIARA
jgi:hypothetical protein